MNILALQGSPRLRGNTSTLLDAFLEPFRTSPALQERTPTKAHNITRFDVCSQHIRPCLSCYACKKQGSCPVVDDMACIYSHLSSDDVVILASPIYFYSFTAQLKAVIDRCQTFWVNPNTRVTERVGVLLLTAGAPDVNKTGQEATIAQARVFFECIGAPLRHTLVAVNTDKSPVHLQQTILDDARGLAISLVRP